jgi:hypothetical protein
MEIDSLVLKGEIVVLAVVPVSSFSEIYYTDEAEGTEVNILPEEISTAPADTVSVGGAFTFDTVVTGTMYTENGAAAAGIVIKLVPEWYNPLEGKPLPDELMAITNTQGEWVIRGAEAGAYVLEAIDINDFSMTAVRPVTVAGDTTVVAGDTLRPSGTLVAHLTDTVVETGGFIYIPGTSIYMKVDSASMARKRTTLSAVPAGSYAELMYAGSPDKSQAVTLARAITVKSGETAYVGPYHAWEHSAQIRLNTSPTGADVAENVMDFPFLVRLNESNFDFSKAKPCGEDIRFTKSDHTPLHYEIERWDAASQMAEIWVRLDTVYGDSYDQFFVIHWGRKDAADESDGGAVFDTSNGFLAVFHLNENGNNDSNGYRDATYRRAHGTGYNFNAGSDREGQVGTAQLFNGNDNYIVIPYDGPGKINLWHKSFTLCAWARRDSLDHSDYIFGQGWDSSHVGLNVGFRSENYFVFDLWGAWLNEKYYNYSTDWTYWAATLDDEAHLQSIFKNGAEDNYIFRDDYVGYGDFFIGKAEFIIPESFIGMIDEVRISNRVRSRFWIRLCYENQKTVQPLVNIGSENM